MVFADPPYMLSNGGITCHAGQMVSVDKGEWDRSMGVEMDHEFVMEWLGACRRVMKKDATIWVSGTHHMPATPMRFAAYITFSAEWARYRQFRSGTRLTLHQT